MTEEVRLLLVEDDVLAASGLRMVLVDAGFEVVISHSGREVVGLLLEHSPHVLLLDLTLPDIDGVALAKIVRDGWPNLPIIFTTGHERPGRLEPMLATRGTSFLRKPFELDTLIETIHRMRIRETDF